MSVVDINPNERMLILHQNIVNLVNQLNMPLIEVSLVVAKYIKILSEKLMLIAEENQEVLPEIYTESWPLELEEIDSDSKTSINLEKLIEIVDDDRMDILDTLIRTSINNDKIPLSDSLLVLRSWEKLLRTQLSSSTSPGQLFSTIEIPEDY